MAATSAGRRDTQFYIAMILAAVGVFLLVRMFGDGLSAPAPSGTLFTGNQQAHVRGPIRLTLLALSVVLISGRVMASLLRRIGQPPVIGEIMAGIMLGPSLLGHLSQPTMDFLFPKSIVPNLSIISQVGVILYMFIVGLELDIEALKNRGRSAIVISHASIVVPFLLGSMLALLLYPRVSSSDVPFTVFALFIGVSMSVTAFPVLARILTDRGLQGTPLGTVALTCAAVDDVTAWCLLAMVVGIAQSSMQGVVVTVGLVAVYLTVMLLVLRPYFARWVQRYGAKRPLNQSALAGICIAVLLSAWATQEIGIHALFGAFLMGAILPHDAEIAHDLRRRLEDLVIVLFLPAFFVVTGLRTEIGLVSGLSSWLLCGFIILVASLGKFGGTLFAAKASGITWRQSSALGILMNTRGLMELVVLNIGFDMGVLSRELFTMMVIMAVVTTMATTPILDLILKPVRATEPEYSPVGTNPAG